MGAWVTVPGTLKPTLSHDFKIDGRFSHIKSRKIKRVASILK